jgi:hypothetical protein
MKAQQLILVILLVAFAFSLLACGGAATPAPPTATPTAHPGERLVASRCSTCHTLETVKGAKYSSASWATVVERMVGKGAQLDQTQQAQVVEYLAATYATE